MMKEIVKGVIVVQSKGELNHNEIPFEIPLKPKGNKQLYETYHGVFVNVQYYLRCEMKRSLLSKDLQCQAEFIVEMKESKEVSSKPVQFAITPDSLEKVENKPKIPQFLVKGQLDTVNCSILQPLTGELTVVETDTPIKSIEIQLVRVETCGMYQLLTTSFYSLLSHYQNTKPFYNIFFQDVQKDTPKMAWDSSGEWYTKMVWKVVIIMLFLLQIADGDVCRGFTIPIYMIFPRLFTCPTLATPNFKVEFEVNVVIVLQDNHLITENFPIKILRF
ncbi:hypothetical protein QZH41_018556 [Actinostola sp. cb2023]|nr:hypothetical protein QZH41_018556 [Actinostola sp. cb2023]